jgi:hypothetical protein
MRFGGNMKKEAPSSVNIVVASAFGIVNGGDITIIPGTLNRNDNGSKSFGASIVTPAGIEHLPINTSPVKSVEELDALRDKMVNQISDTFAAVRTQITEANTPQEG